MVAELQRRGLCESTLINPALRGIVDKHLVPGIVNGVQAGLVAQATEDDIALLWLADQNRTGAAPLATS
jgi:hypothetical protein